MPIKLRIAAVRHLDTLLEINAQALGTLLLDLLSPMAPVILKRPLIENTTVLTSHPDAIDQADALLESAPKDRT